MENDMFNDPLDMAGQNSVILDAISLNTTSNSLAQSCSFDLNTQNQIMAGYPLLSTLQEHFSEAHADLRMTNRVGFFDSGALFSSVGRNAIRDVSIGGSHPASNTEFEEQFVGGTPISAASIATLLATRSDAQENLNHIRNSAASIHPLEVLRTYVSNDSSNASNSSFVNSMNCGYAEVLGNMNNSKWSFELGGKTPVSSGFQPVSPIGNLDLNGWLSSNSTNVSTDHPYASSELSNELSLSLATSWPSVIGGSTVADQCSVTHLCLNETGLGSEQTSCNSKELSLSFGSYKPGQFSQLISGSRYLHVIQEILAQIASYSLENLDQTSYAGKNGAGANKPFSSGWPSQKRASPTASDGFPDVDGTFEVQTEPAMQRQVVEAKKAQLLTLLQVVDDRYNQCVDEIHTVISAFHAATELDPQIHARFSLQSISFLYKNLRDRISNQILAMGAHFDKENERSFETSFIQKQWALQQLKRKDHQLWRPQRGLPERSVSVLRAWMFQNFLHPYPKDSEKQLLAVKSGLTRSQVSNWFINARVRLWKPMIEEMYFEMNRRKAQWNEKGTDSSHRSIISIDEM